MKHLARTLTILALALGATTSAADLTFTVDVPASLARTDYLPNQTVSASGSALAVEFDGEAAGLTHVNLNALFKLGTDRFLFSTDVPVDIDGTTYQASDVVEFDGVGYQLFFGGADARLPEGTNVDAIAVDAQGRLLLSFDAPVSVGQVSFLPADIVHVDGTWLAHDVNAGTLGLGPDVDVIGFDRTPDGDLFLFDAPVTVGGLTFLPGEVALHDGSDWFSHWTLDDYPAYAASNGLSLGASPGAVDTLLAGKQGPDVLLAWTGGCSSADDFAIVEGTLGDWDSHQPVQCTTEGATAQAVSPAAGDRYFLVVPLSDLYEGDYGFDSAGNARDAAMTPCRPEQRPATCS